MPSSLAILLAAGEGTRMRSALPKVLHPLGGRPMLDWSLAAARAAGCDRLAVVIGSGAEKVAAHLGKVAPAASLHVQPERLGTAHAVLAAAPAFAGDAPPDEVIVLYGDTPFVAPQTLAALRARLADGADVVFLGFRAADPTGYGRLVTEGDRLTAIVEEREADAATRAITFCNSGIVGLRGGLAGDLLRAVGNANLKGEYYLTDVAAIAAGRGLRVEALEGAEAEFLGINDRVQLAAAEALFQTQARTAAMRAGVTMIAPETVFLAHDTVLGRDVVIEPNVVFGPGVTVADDVTLRAFSHIEGATVASGAIIGPYARLRPGADIGPEAHVGNFVEIKNATLAPGVKANHLSYIGDADIGTRTNIGAGTITCNYDGVFKHRTTIGADVFVGSDSVLVAPITIGDDALLAAGGTFTEDVEPGAMAFGRARQASKSGRGAALKAELRARKKT